MTTKNGEAPKGYEIPELAKPRIRKNPPAVEVVIKGDPGSGKSEIMKIIAEALEAKGLQAVYHMGGAGAHQIIPMPPSASHDERLIKVVEEWGTVSEPSDTTRVMKGLAVAKEQADKNRDDPQCRGSVRNEEYWRGFGMGIAAAEVIVSVCLPNAIGVASTVTDSQPKQ